VGASGAGEVVALFQVGGGFTTVTWHLMEGPRLVVTGDGRAVADSLRELRLDPAELADLLAAQRRDLAGVGPTPNPDAGMAIADAPTTRLEVAGPGGSPVRVSAYALSEGLGYPAALLAARDRMERLAQRVLREGTPYTADRIRVVVEPAEADPGVEVVPWPERVALPDPAPAAPARVAELSGAAAATAASLLPGADWRAGGERPVLRAADGKLYSVAWRYLTVAD
jgi:hypothetical protein